MNTKLNRIINVLLISIIALYTGLSFVIATDFNGFLFYMRRKDIMAAAREVERQEQLIIQKKIKEVQKQSIRKILTPVITTTK